MPAASSVAWIQLAFADIQAARNSVIAAAYQSTSTNPGQADPVVAAIVFVTEEILGVMGFSGRYTMDASYGTLSPNKIPPNLKDMAAQKVCRRLQARLEVPLSEQDRDDEREYQRRVSLLREGRWPVDLTDNPGNNLSANPGRVTYSFGRSHFRACDLGGI